MATKRNFSAETEAKLHEILARAINRAIENGTYYHVPIDDGLDEVKDKEEADQSLTG